jgi:hypothetical protein
VESYSREFALFIDGIRIEKGMTRIDFIDEIVSLSQYKRYLKGAAPIPNNIIILLADRLKYNITDLYLLYSRKHNKEAQELNEIYNILIQLDYKTAYEKLKNFNAELIISNYYKSFYDFMMIFIQYKLDKVSDIHVLTLYTELIDYPQCLKNEVFNFVELNVLSQIILIASSMENFEPVNKMYDLFTSREFNYTGNDDKSIIPLVYYNLARAIYRQNDYERTIDLVKIGISEAVRNENSNALPHLLLLAANSLYFLEKFDESLSYFKKSINLLLIQDKESTALTFKQYYVNSAINKDELVDELIQFLK